MQDNKGFEKFSDIAKAKPANKYPAYEWQDLALRIIKELNIPQFKKNSVFKVCRDNSKQFILKCFNDTKELCKSGAQWKYFFKIVNNK